MNRAGLVTLSCSSWGWSGWGWWLDLRAYSCGPPVDPETGNRKSSTSSPHDTSQWFHLHYGGWSGWGWQPWTSSLDLRERRSTCLLLSGTRGPIHHWQASRRPVHSHLPPYAVPLPRVHLVPRYLRAYSCGPPVDPETGNRKSSTSRYKVVEGPEGWSVHFGRLYYSSWSKILASWGTRPGPEVGEPPDLWELTWVKIYVGIEGAPSRSTTRPGYNLSHRSWGTAPDPKGISWVRHGGCKRGKGPKVAKFLDR